MLDSLCCVSRFMGMLTEQQILTEREIMLRFTCVPSPRHPSSMLLMTRFVRNVFRGFDVDGSGSIDQTEVSSSMAALAAWQQWQ